MSPWVRGLDHARSALPMMVMALMAAGSWWLVQSAPDASRPKRAERVITEPDYELQKARIERYDVQGRLDFILDGDTIRHYEPGDPLEIEAVRVSARDERGQRMHAVARQAVAQGDADQLVLHGGARVVATPASAPAGAIPLTFEGEVLKVDAQAHEFSSDQPVTITNAMGRVEAGAMRHEERTGITHLTQRVTGRYSAPAKP